MIAKPGQAQKAIIILNYNGAWLLPQFLPSAIKTAEASKVPTSVYVVDNASSDDSISVLKEKWPEVIIVRSDENLLWAGGNNLGAKVALRDNPHLQWLIFLNNDALVPANFTDGITEVPKGHNDIGIIGVKTLFLFPYAPLKIWHGVLPDGSDRHGTIKLEFASEDPLVVPRIRARFPEAAQSAWIIDRTEQVNVPAYPDSQVTLNLQHRGDHHSRVFCHVESLTQKWIFRLGFEQELAATLNLPQTDIVDMVNNAGSWIEADKGECGDIGFDEQDQGQFDTSRFVDSICGVAMAVRPSVFQKMQGFDRTYSLYFEDTDFSARAGLAGYKCWYNCDVTIRHLHSATSKERSEFWNKHVFWGNWVFRHRFQHPKAFKSWKKNEQKSAEQDPIKQETLIELDKLALKPRKKPVPSNTFQGRSLCP